MKLFAVFIASWVCIVSLNAQKITERHINMSDRQSLDLDIQITDSINIMTWDKNEVYIRASVNINDNKDNEGYSIGFRENNDKVSVEARFREGYFKDRRNNCVRSEIAWSVYLPENISFSVSTINGDVIIRGKTGQMDVKSISGFIDLSVPAKRSADLDFSTVTGTVYTDLDLGALSEPVHASTSIRKKLNGGGALIRLETVSGDMFFRKAD